MIAAIYARKCTRLFGRHGPTGGRIRRPSGWRSFAHDSGQVGSGQGIATPHASATFTWCVQGSSGCSSQTQPSAHRPQDFTAMGFRIQKGASMGTLYRRERRR
jgi:hypothetical protein